MNTSFEKNVLDCTITVEPVEVGDEYLTVTIAKQDGSSMNEQYYSLRLLYALNHSQTQSFIANSASENPPDTFDFYDLQFDCLYECDRYGDVVDELDAKPFKGIIALVDNIVDDLYME